MSAAPAIRPLFASDQEFLWEILYEALWDPPNKPRRARSVLERKEVRIYAEAWSSQADDLGFVALSDAGSPVGAIWSRLLLPPNEGGAFFNSFTPQLGIAVLPPHQGQGIGRHLLSHHLAVAGRIYPSLSLGVHPANTRAIQLYRRVGFSQFGLGGGGYVNMVIHLGEARGLGKA